MIDLLQHIKQKFEESENRFIIQENNLIKGIN